jgi:hypothetical protein
VVSADHVGAYADYAGLRVRDRIVVNARAVEYTQGELHELKTSAVESAALALAAFGGALAASELHPKLAGPLLVGAVGMTFLAARAFVRRYLRVEDLAFDRDALAIPEVRRYAERASTPERRRRVAASVRAALDASAGDVRRVEENRARLEELEAALLDEELALDPSAAVALDRLSSGGWDTLYGCLLPDEELRARLQRILAGFGAVPAAGGRT